MNESKRNVVLYIIILILACIIIGLGVYVFYNKDDSCECTKCKNNNSKGNVVEPTATPEPTPTFTPDPDKDKLVTSITKINEDKLPMSRKINFNGKISTLEIKNGEYSIKNILLDGKVFYTLTSSFSVIDSVYVLNEEVILVFVLNDCDQDELYAFDKDLNEIKINMTLDKEYPKTMQFKKTLGTFVDMETNTIKLTGTRSNGCEATLKSETGDPHGTYIYEDGGSSNVRSEFIGELYRATYEIKYLGNGKFSDPVRVNGSEIYLTKDYKW